MNGKGLALILVLMFGLAVGAGVVAAKLAGKLTTHKDPAPDARQGTLADELGLTPAQSAQMRTIWLKVSEKSEQLANDAKAIQVAEDKELINRILTTDEQKKQFQELRNESTGKLSLLEAERKAAFDKAVAQTMPILSAAQQRIYLQIIKEHTGVLPDSTPGAGSGQ